MSSTQTSYRNQNSDRQQNTSPTRHYEGHCVCEICTCNHHRCPPKTIGYGPDILKSTMKKDYPPYQVQRSGRGKQQPYVPLNYGPNLMQTTAQADYTPKKAQRPHEKNKQEYTPCNVPFNGDSEYKNSYIKNDVPLQRAGKLVLKPYDKGAPFNAESTYAENYKGQQGPRDRPKPQQQKSLYNTPFSGTTSYQQEYKKFNVPRGHQTQKKPYVPDNVPFEGKTSYQNDYNNFDPCRYQNKHCPIYDLPSRPCNCTAGKNHLYYHDQEHRWE